MLLQDPKDALLREYQSEIQKLKEMLDNKPESSFVQAGNGYIITWKLHQIFMYSNKVKLAAG